MRQASEINRIKNGYVCAEIGVWEGQLSQYILNKNPKKLHLIDPWVHQDFPVDDPKELRIYCCGQEKMDAIYNNVANRFQYDPRVEIHRMFSCETKFPQEYFDWVYIDGNHSYENVLQDLNHYLKFMKSGGFLCGDDYGEHPYDPYSNGGPERAVQEFIQQTGFKLELHEEQFCIFIP